MNSERKEFTSLTATEKLKLKSVRYSILSDVDTSFLKSHRPFPFPRCIPLSMTTNFHQVSHQFPRHPSSEYVSGNSSIGSCLPNLRPHMLSLSFQNHVLQMNKVRLHPLSLVISVHQTSRYPAEKETWGTGVAPKACSVCGKHPRCQNQ